MKFYLFANSKPHPKCWRHILVVRRFWDKKECRPRRGEKTDRMHMFDGVSVEVAAAKPKDGYEDCTITDLSGHDIEHTVIAWAELPGIDEVEWCL